MCGVTVAWCVSYTGKDTTDYEGQLIVDEANFASTRGVETESANS